MIVDVHTRTWNPGDPFHSIVSALPRAHTPDPWDRLDACGSAHHKAMEPVDCAFVLGFESALLDTAIPLETVAEYVNENPDKTIGFAGIDPLAGNFKRKLEQAHELGLKGVTINPAAQGLHPTHTKAFKLYKLCLKYNFPVIIEGGGTLDSRAKLEFDQPYLFDDTACEFPDLNLIFTSIDDTWIDQALMLGVRHKKVFIDLSTQINRPWALYRSLLSAYQRGIIDKILFSSNFPFTTPEQAIMTIYSTNALVQGGNLPSVPREQLRSIVERDTLGVLGLSKPQTPAAPTEPVKAEA